MTSHRQQPLLDGQQHAQLERSINDFATQDHRQHLIHQHEHDFQFFALVLILLAAVNPTVATASTGLAR